jgi:hypothetical protein
MKQIRALFIGGALFIFGFVGLFFEQSKSMAPFIVGAAMPFLVRFMLGGDAE